MPRRSAADDKAAADKLAADAAAAAAKDGKSGGDATGDKAGEGKPAPKVPKDYALTIPEGGYLTESDLARVRTAAEIYGWDEAQTQQEINLHASHVKALSESFLSEAKADAEYGGQNFDRTRALADKALARVRPEGHPRAEAFRQLLARSGYNHNVEVLAFLADFGKMLGEDGGLQDTNQGGDQLSTDPFVREQQVADKLYGKTKVT